MTTDKSRADALTDAPSAIVTRNGDVILVDADDFAELSQYVWYVGNRGYAYRIRRDGRRRTHVVMHRQILGLDHDDCRVTDHVNGNKIDNRRENLRICDQRENMRNQKLPRHNTTGYKGVHRVRTTGRFAAQIRINDRCICIGTFDTAEEAAHAYNRTAVECHGEFARLNVPGMPYDRTNSGSTK
ncbi:TPA: HNH endonuclease [Burkholderia cenocepacia]|uniref:HNH endonuclease n=1 Tax=Burkholderia cenocepacia TaxID=95486 RepID=UPI001B978311|nr:HNH endonuclease [Burkholderia cenocepacia]MBR8196354.1 HNH endonuclease [Burkholderia cenocepacia]HDV6327492.1 HNH endonuclease [Burkholderia cenocepacia]HDV6351364.1 HNH endonuclease [Burkholderia cenocepacia]